MRVRSLLSLSLLSLSLLFPDLALAGPKEDAQKRIDNATELFNAGKAAEAAEELKEAYLLDPTRIDVLYGIGQTYASLGDCDKAKSFYERYIATKPDPDKVAVARDALAGCKPKQGANAVELQIHLDKAGALFAAGKAAEALVELEAAYAIESRPDVLYAMGQAHAKLGDCDRARIAYEKYLATKPDADKVALTQQVMAGCKPKQPPPPPQPAVKRWYADPLGLALVGAGVVVGGIGIFEYTAARADRADADSTTVFQDYLDLIDSAKRKRTLAIVFGAAGAAAIGGGLLHMMLRDRGTGDSVQITPTPGGAAVSWTGRF